MRPRGTHVLAMVVGLVCLLVASCSTTPPSSPSAPALHTVDVTGTACAGVGLVDATLHGSPTDPRVAWIAMAGGTDTQAVFPMGFTARFTPALEVLDTSGTVKFREGDKIDGACVGDNELLIGWP